MLGANTASFNEDGQIASGDTLSGSDIELRYPKYNYGYMNRMAQRTITDVGIGGNVPIYSASVDRKQGQQDYDLQTIISESAATDTGKNYYGKVGSNRVTIRKVFYKSPRAMWRFYGYYGGFSVVGNLRTYGQFADDSTFDIVPVWQNKLQAIAYEDALNVRISHYSYEIKNNNLRIYPEPTAISPEKFWVEFTVEDRTPWEDDTINHPTTKGVNNMNQLPFSNLPYNKINSIGKQWIRRFALALTKEMLGQIRGKFNTIPIPGESVTLNFADLLGQAKAEQDALREELKVTLDELTYQALIEKDSGATANSNTMLGTIPAGIYVG